MAVVVDASALVELLLRTPLSSAVVGAIDGDDMLAPDLINVEVASALRRLVRLGELGQSRADEAIDDLRDAPLRRVPTVGLLVDIWNLRGAVSAYGAAYVALARAAGTVLITSDGRLARARGIGVPIVAVLN